MLNTIKEILSVINGIQEYNNSKEVKELKRSALRAYYTQDETVREVELASVEVQLHELIK